MARRLVRDQAALIAIALVAVAACSKRGCACLASYSPEIGVADLDPLAFELWEPSERSSGRLVFPLGKPAEDDICPKLPDGTSIALNGVPGSVSVLGGATGTKIGNVNCKRAEASWREGKLAKEAAIVVDDGKAKLECKLSLGLPLRLTTPAVKASGDTVTLTIESDAPGASLSAEQAQVGVDGEVALMPVSQGGRVNWEGNRVTLTVPTKYLPSAGTYRVVLDATVKTIPTCTPARKTAPAADVHVRSISTFTVTR